MARWFSVLVIAFVVTACSSSTEIPTVAEDPWATPEDEKDAGPKDAGQDEFRPPCGNGDTNCDPRNLGGETCAGLGMGDGKLACDPVTCTYDTSMCEDDTSTGMGNGGNGAGNGNNNGNGNGNAGAGSSQPPFFGGGAGGSDDEDDDQADGGAPFFGGQFFGGNGNGNGPE